MNITSFAWRGLMELDYALSIPTTALDRATLRRCEPKVDDPCLSIIVL